jgi:small-conductance mechanosensitive channel
VLAIVGVAYYTRLASELTVLVFSTVGGLIVSLALQATLSNVIAGLFLLQDGTLRLGDEITYSSVTGKVVRITLRSSWIITEKGSIAVVANSQLMNGPLVNRGATSRLVKRYHLEAEMPHGSHHEPGPDKNGEGISTREDEATVERRAKKGPDESSARENQ